MDNPEILQEIQTAIYNYGKKHGKKPTWIIVHNNKFNEIRNTKEYTIGICPCKFDTILGLYIAIASNPYDTNENFLEVF